MTLIFIMSVLFFSKLFFQNFSSRYFRFVTYFSFFKLFTKNSIRKMIADVLSPLTRWSNGSEIDLTVYYVYCFVFKKSIVRNHYSNVA